MHPEIPDSILLEALQRKQSRAHYMVSQLCFDADALIAWERKVRAAGIELPLHVSVAAPMNMARLTELSVRIGVGCPVRYLAKQSGFVTNIMRAYRSEDLETVFRCAGERDSRGFRRGPGGRGSGCRWGRW